MSGGFTIAIDTIATVPRSLKRGIEKFEIGGQIKTIQITALLKSVGILRRVSL